MDVYCKAISETEMGMSTRYVRIRRSFLPFVEQAFDDLEDHQKLVFERLLTCDDPDLFAWFMGHQKCKDPELSDMIKMVLNRVKV